MIVNLIKAVVFGLVWLAGWLMLHRGNVKRENTAVFAVCLLLLAFLASVEF